jgi:hypothetical protein
MSRMSELMIDIQNDINRGELTFHQIADKHLVPFSWVNEAAMEMIREAYDNDYIVDNDYNDDY